MSEPAVFAENQEGAAPVLVLCDHATNRVPPCVNGGSLGICAADMNRHIAFDIGALAVARLLAATLDAPLLATNFSRLVIDPNRGEDDPTLLMKLYDGTIIEGNRHADATEKQRRLDAFHRPYHNAISARLEAWLNAGITPAVISIHSFTPQLRGRGPRPWHIGVLWDEDRRMAQPLIEQLSENPALVVGSNEPYAGSYHGDTMYFHATRRGLPQVLIELRNDLIETEAGQAQWAGVLAPVLSNILKGLD
ncbi:N-formylglutamate amidohydrolase [Abyssibius alkaniclasticus]|uniref:N-formylglutamate amidohydrolase n=1 Tax=Abyssibius alkaniclasticus TaxID=2881234 RepID=UPI002364746F|nr:N-formylglutamate amidohydrolase [Abyssibius alkaniclasticus]UPH71399.1 N-formylglutamate amidohydrolase [Abyssibius alkaniclasticus]